MMKLTKCLHKTISVNTINNVKDLGNRLFDCDNKCIGELIIKKIIKNKGKNKDQYPIIFKCINNDERKIKVNIYSYILE